MKQSQTYYRHRNINIDPDAYKTYRMGVALRIQRRTHGRIYGEDALSLATIPAFFLWLFRKPRAFFKRRKLDRKIRHKIDKTNSGFSENK